MELQTFESINMMIPLFVSEMNLRRNCVWSSLVFFFMLQAVLPIQRAYQYHQQNCRMDSNLSYSYNLSSSDSVLFCHLGLSYFLLLCASCIKSTLLPRSLEKWEAVEGNSGTSSKGDLWHFSISTSVWILSQEFDLVVY